MTRGGFLRALVGVPFVGLGGPAVLGTAAQRFYPGAGIPRPAPIVSKRAREVLVTFHGDVSQIRAALLNAHVRANLHHLA